MVATSGISSTQLSQPLIGRGRAMTSNEVITELRTSHTQPQAPHFDPNLIQNLASKFNAASGTQVIMPEMRQGFRGYAGKIEIPGRRAGQRFGSSPQPSPEMQTTVPQIVPTFWCSSAISWLYSGQPQHRLLSDESSQYHHQMSPAGGNMMIPAPDHNQTPLGKTSCKVHENYRILSFLSEYSEHSYTSKV